MSDKLRQAAERLANGLSSYWGEARAVAYAYLELLDEQHPADDDDEPADEAFAKSLGIEYHRRFRGDKWIANVIANVKGHTNHIFVEDATRGELRRLLKALHVQ